QVILVSDYGKLSAVGDGATTIYAWTNADTTAAIQALNATTQQTVYSAMLPTLTTTVPLVQLKPDLVGLFNTSTVGVFCGLYTGASRDFNGAACPFQNALSGNVLSSWFQLIAGKETSVNEAWTFGTFNTDNGLATVPPTVVTGTLFSTGSNGGGAYPPAW